MAALSEGRRRMLLLAPFAVVAAGGVGFYAMLQRMEVGRFDPHALDNPLVGKPFPEFSLPALAPARGFSPAELRAAAAARPVLVNFFASWCVPCAAEADLLGGLSQLGLAIWGVLYKDKPGKAAAFLDRYGNPYARINDDVAGRAAIDWGLYGVPESYLIDRTGRISWHLAGPLSEEIVRDQLQPALKAAS